MKRSFRFVVLLLVTACAVLACAVPSYCAVVYVKWDSPNDGPGNDWDHACHTVTAGLAAAVSGDEVWVAQGTYVERITLKDGVALYGGFVGTETAREQRDWKANVVILDGNHGGNVVKSPTGATPSTRMDGFTIRNGKAWGGGVYCDHSSPTIANNVITANTAATGYGGGITVYGSPVITGNTITANNAYDDGGGIWVSGSPTIEGNTISANVARGWGGGIWVGGASSLPLIAHNIIARNRDDSGRCGGIYCSYSASPTIANNVITANNEAGIRAVNSSKPAIANCTITANGGAGVYLGTTASVKNCIIAFNSAGIQAPTIGVVLESNCVYGNMTYNYSGVADPTDTAGNISADPKLASVEYGDSHIQPDSPCVDAGDNAWALSDYDIDGQARVQPGGGRVDIGADESDGTTWPAGPYAIIRVSPTGDDANDGLFWSSAKRSVQAGVDAASAVGGEVWVEGGTYNEHIALHAFSYMYGGFAGVETHRDQRNWKLNITTLDGQKDGSVVSALEGCRASRIDGFVIQNGSASNGGGVNASGAATNIVNNVITGNSASSNGGGVCSSGPSRIAGNTIAANRAKFGGGVKSAPGSEVTLNLITGNYASDSGGGVSGVGALANNVIAGNSAFRSGGGVNTSGSLIANDTIVGNTAQFGGGVYCASYTTTVANSIIAFNSSGVGASSVGTAVLKHNCVYGNTEINYQFLTDPTGTDGNISVDPGFAGADFGNWHIQPDSPCVDAGNNAYAPGECDIDGQPRIQPSGGTVDIGADESDGTVWSVTRSAIVRVSMQGDDLNDGTSWQAAKRTVQAGVNAVLESGGEVWVKAEIHYGTVTLRPYVSLYGGFAGTETERDQRNPVSNITILDGGRVGSVVTAPPSYQTGTIDGFTIRNGSGTKFGGGPMRPSGFYGGGIFCSDSSPSVSNCIITNNGGQFGCGIYCNGGAPLISRCAITNNTSGASSFAWGGGVLCDNNSEATIADCIISHNSIPKYCAGGIELVGSLATITRNRIEFNTAYWASAGIDTNGGSPTISDNIIRGNVVTNEYTADYAGGGGMWAAGGSPLVVNNTFVDNKTGAKGGAIWLNSTSGTFANNVIAFNSSGVYGLAPLGSPVFANNCFYGNKQYDYSGLPAGPTDIFADPMLTGDYHITPFSPCIDAGWNDAPGMGLADIDGQGRIWNGIVDIGADEVWPMAIKIDIRPGAQPNPINLKSNGVVPVAILSDGDFSAQSVDPATVTFAGAPVATQGQNGRLMAGLMDVDGDGDLDLLMHFETRQLRLNPDSTSAGLGGWTYDGWPVEGWDSVIIIPR